MNYQPLPGEDPYDDQSQTHWQTLPSSSAQRSITPTPSAPPSTTSAAPSAPPVRFDQHTVSDEVAPLIPEDAPPSYEVAISKDIPQIHDNYDHLRGPRAVRGVEDKTRIPLDSTPYYQQGGSGGAGSSLSPGVGSSSNAGPSTPRSASSAYGSFPPQHQQHQPPIVPIAQPSAPTLPELGRRGQIALDPDSPIETSGHRGTDVHSTYSDESGEQDESCWSSVSEPRPWFALFYHVLFILPWALFCQAWVLCVGITSFMALIFPPLGYLLIIPSVTSWRALARADLEMSALLVSDDVRHKYGDHRVKHPVYIPMDPVNYSPWNLVVFGHRIPIPSAFSTWRQRRSQRRARGLWKRSVKHLKDTIKDNHTTRSFFYFLIGKFMIALLIFVVIIFFLSLSIPFMLCLLPSLLKLSTKFANMQYRWALTWLTDKSEPIVVA
ncbi:hypothetical protein BGW42_006703 [Actinomortierella wolfii]|nr:hypothetical protein BGW42_006703 [Actinomortierella wolfii]